MSRLLDESGNEIEVGDENLPGASLWRIKNTDSRESRLVWAVNSDDAIKILGWEGVTCWRLPIWCPTPKKTPSPSDPLPIKLQKDESVKKEKVVPPPEPIIKKEPIKKLSLTEELGALPRGSKDEMIPLIAKVIKARAKVSGEELSKAALIKRAGIYYYRFNLNKKV